MRHFYFNLLSISFIITAFSVQSQPMLTSQNLPSDGDSYTVYTNTNLSAGSNPGASGSNVTWDFSMMSSGTSNSLIYSSASATNYPNANIEFTTQSTSNYFDVTNGAYTYYGFSNANASSVFSDGQDQIRVPMSFNDNYTDPFSGTYNAFGQTLDRTGDLDVTYDGYGTLSTPQGTYSNVIRVRIVRTSSDEINGQPITNSLDSIFFWYNEYTGHPIMTYTINYVDGNEQGRFANYIDDADVVLSIPEESIQVSAFPNPVRSIHTIEAEKNIESILVYNMRGEEVLRKEPRSNSFKINVGSLPNGQYFYEMRNQKGVLLSRRKLIVQ